LFCKHKNKKKKSSKCGGLFMTSYKYRSIYVKVGSEICVL